jgi:hypothetical protein
MHDESKQVPPGDEGTERVVLYQLLRDDHPVRWTRVGLERALYDVDRTAIREAVASLAVVGGVILNGKHVQASACAWRIDALGMIAI